MIGRLYHYKAVITIKYKYTQYEYDKPIGHILIDMTETNKSYKIKLIENTTYLDYDHFINLFKNGDTVFIGKANSPHAVRIWEDGDFTIYPNRAGIPFWFQKIE